LLADFREAPMIIAVVGDKSTIDVDAIAKFGVVHHVTPEQVFGYGEFPVDAD
jgi:hypothetical protein